MLKNSRRIGISLRHLLDDANFLGADDLQVQTCTSDAASVKPGDVYVAVLTPDHDGHDGVNQAISRGASGLVLERPVAAAGVACCIVDDTRIALGRICQAAVGEPSNDLCCVGITGTDGKTTTSQLVTSVLSNAGQSVVVLDDLSRPILAASQAHTFPIALAASMAEAAAQGRTHAVMEVSSRDLAEHRFAGVQFDAVCITNIARAHLNIHNTPQTYRRMKARILDHLRRDQLVVLNGDDPNCQRLAAEVRGPLRTFSMRQPADVTGEVIERNAAEQTFLISNGLETMPVRTRIIGDQHVTNCLAAAAIGVAAGLDLPTIAAGLERVVSLPGRMQRVAGVAGRRVILDTASTPTALAKSILALKQSSAGRVRCVLGVGDALTETASPTLAQVAGCLADELVLTSREYHMPLEIDHAMHVLGDHEPLADCEGIGCRQAAITSALRTAGLDDTVLIVAPHDDEHLYGPAAHYEQDRHVIEQIVSEEHAGRIAAETASPLTGF